jgi:hypothetical protein
MGRKHKSKSIKYINDRLKQENVGLQGMVNYMSLKNTEIQKKATELENYNYGMVEILKIQKVANDFQQQKIEMLETNLSLLNEHNYGNNSEFSRSLSLACSIKTDKFSSEKNENSNKIFEIE